MTPDNSKIVNKENNTDVKAILAKYLRYWPYIVGFTLLVGIIAYFYLKTQANVYVTNAKVLVKNTDNGATPSELDAFADLGLKTGQTNMYNEIEVLKSRILINDVVRKLKLNLSYTKLNSKIESDELIYGSKNPIEMQFKTPDTLLYQSKGKWRVNLNKKQNFDLEGYINEEWTSLGTFSFDEWIDSSVGKIKIVLNSNRVENKPMLIQVNLQPLKWSVDYYKDEMDIFPVNQDATVLELKLKGKLAELNETFINTLVEQHEKQAIEDKNEIAKNTSRFIDERLSVFESELDKIEKKSEDFKTSNQLIDMESNASQYMTKSGELETKLIQSNIENTLAEYMLQYLDKDDEKLKLLPSNLGFQDPSIVKNINEYNKLVLKRRRVAENSTEQNPLVSKLDRDIEGMRDNIKKSLINLEKTLKIRLEKLQNKEEEYDQKIGNIPGYERQFRGIARQQQIKETIYLYLLQKKEENQISMASAVGNIKLLDPAFTDPKPVSPERRKTFLFALMLGLAVPVGVIYAVDVLDTKVRRKADIDKLGIPLLGEVPENDLEDYVVVKKDNRSLIAEAFRMIRTNLSFYVTKETNDKGQVVFLTSTIAGEGKTFNSVNIAASLGLINKKVVLVGLDLRAPKIKDFLDIKTKLGVTNYIVEEDLTIADITTTYQEATNFDVIHSGAIPPNPSELLLNKRLEKMFVDLKEKYDYVIVDNPPMSLVTDTMSIIHMADVLIYVIRMGTLDKSYLDIPEELYKNKKIKNMSLILNDTKYGFGGYRGYGYGYGYGKGYGSGYGQKPKKKFWKRK